MMISGKYSIKRQLLFACILCSICVAYATGCEDMEDGIEEESVDVEVQDNALFAGSTNIPDIIPAESIAFLHGCTGLLISPTAVLTANHCGMAATAGFYTNEQRTTREEIPMIKRYNHSITDMSIFELDRPPVFAKPYNNFVPDTDNSILNYQMYTAGYGTQYTAANAPNGVSDTFSVSADEWINDGIVYGHNIFYANGTVTISMTGNGNADLYVRRGAAPTSSSYHCRPHKSGSSETCTLSGEGWYYYSVVGVAAQSSGTVTLTFNNPYHGGGGVLRYAGGCDVSGPIFPAVQGKNDYRFPYEDCTAPNGVAANEAGDSGSPVFNQNGQIVGIMTNVWTPSQYQSAVYLAWYNSSTKTRPYLDWINNIVKVIDRRASLYIEPDYYMNRYPALGNNLNHNNTRAYEHFENYGISEGRDSSPALSLRDYLAINKDVAKAFGSTNYIAAYRHFQKNGVTEGRRGSLAFDARYYLNRYSDLKNAYGSKGYFKAAKHFAVYGLNEGRRSSPIFDVSWYLNKYPDLKAAFGAKGYQAALIHWQRSGLNEGRQAHPDFSPVAYLSRYADLRKAFGAKNYRAAAIHYLVYGIAEGRNGKP